MQLLVILLFLLFSTLLYFIPFITWKWANFGHFFPLGTTPMNVNWLQKVGWILPYTSLGKVKTLATLPINLFGETTNIWRGDFFTNSHPPPDRVYFRLLIGNNQNMSNISISLIYQIQLWHYRGAEQIYTRPKLIRNCSRYICNFLPDWPISPDWPILQKAMMQ